jgi:hypothetical protein
MVLQRTPLQTRIRSNEGLCMLGPAVIRHVLRDNNLYRHTPCPCRKLVTSCSKAVSAVSFISEASAHVDSRVETGCGSVLVFC